MEFTEKYMIREAAKQIGVESHVLRYWEKELSLAIPKNEMGHRYYTEREISFLRQVKYLKDQGFHLKAIRMLGNNIPFVTKMEMGKLHSLRDRLNGELPQENAAQDTLKTKSSRPVLVKGSRAGVPAGKPVGTQAGEKVVLEQPKQTTQNSKILEDCSPEEEALLKELLGGQEKETTTEEGQPSLLELEISCQEPARSFGVVQGGRSASHHEVVHNSMVNSNVCAENMVKDTAPAAQKEIQQDERMQQFRMIMSDIIGQALRDNNQELAKNVGENVSDKVVKEMDYMFRSQQEEEEERYRKLDETIRSYQKSRQEVAATQEMEKKRHLFGKRNK